MSYKPGVAGSIPGFVRTTSGWAFRCSHHIIDTQPINPPGPVLVTAQENLQKVVSFLMGAKQISDIIFVQSKFQWMRKQVFIWCCLCTVQSKPINWRFHHEFFAAVLKAKDLNTLFLSFLNCILIDCAAAWGFYCMLNTRVIPPEL